ncbi:MAG: thiamine biosynthesis protein [Polyangiaceae bacterium]
MMHTFSSFPVIGPCRVALAVLLLWSGAAAGCRSKIDVTDAAPPPRFVGAEPLKEGGLSEDDLWRRALDGDPIDLARLADREGAGGLLEGLEEGGPISLAALLALPFAVDADLAYQRLGEIVRQLDPRAVGPVVQAIADMASRPRRQSEPLDPPGLRSCGEALLVLAEQKSLAKTVRAPAISALRLLAERGAVNAAAIPTDLDPK